MAKTANTGTAEGYTPLADPEVIEKLTHNQQQKAAGLVRKILHKHHYGIAIMAQQTVKVKKLQAELVELGLPPVDLIEPDFSNEEKLEEYALLSAYQPTRD